MTTAAKPTSSEGSHFYFDDGRPCYEVPYADPRKGNRRTTLADARKLNLLPSVTTILKALHKEGLVNWLIEQACLAVLTSPKQDREALDAFVERVLHTEKVQDEEAQAARDKGTTVHALLELGFTDPSQAIIDPLWPIAALAWEEIRKRGRYLNAELVVVGDGYAGKVDLVQEQDKAIWIWDWKTTRKLPNAAWKEHVLQGAAYAAAYVRRGTTGTLPVMTGNVYINPETGEFTVCEHPAWPVTYCDGFQPLVKVWQYLNSYAYEHRS